MNANANSGIVRNDVVTGARMFLTLRSRPVGYCQNANVGEQFNFLPIEVLDDLMVAEHVAAGYTVTFSTSLVVLMQRDLKQLGIFPTVEGAFTFPEMVGQVKDRPSGGKPLATVIGVKTASRNWNVAKGVITAEQIQFVAKGVRSQNGLL